MRKKRNRAGSAPGRLGPGLLAALAALFLAAPSGLIDRPAPLPDQHFALTVPGSILNIGGLYLAVKIGYHF